MHLPNGTLLLGGRYKIVRFISSGGFGCTYEAEHTMLEKRVAIKEFFVKDFCNRDEQTAHVTVATHGKRGLVDKLRKKFIAEAKALSHLSHTNIVRVSDVFEENGTAYYVMDFISGMSLADIVKREGKLPQSRAEKYIRAVAQSLKYVHSHSILHLDIKPSNIMIDDSDNAILIDFGTAKQYDEDSGENTSTLMGKTPGYAPLEQMGNDVVTFTPATDIYALGATFYKLLTGITPLGAHLLASGDTLAPLPSSISPSVAAAITAAMSLRLNARPQSIDAFLSLLDKATEGDGGEVTVLDSDPKAPEKPKRNEPNNGNNKGGDGGGSKTRTIIYIAIGLVVGVVITLLIARNSSTTITSSTLDSIVAVFDSIDTIKEVKDVERSYKGKSYTYTGPVNANGNAEGKGTGRYDTGTYEGNYVDGCRSGEGTYTRDDGKFNGTFENDEYSQGTLTSKDGLYFVGTFRKMEPYDGQVYNANGSVYGTYTKGVFE